MRFLLIFLFTAGFVAAANEVPKTPVSESLWQVKLRVELARAEKLGLVRGPYDVSASSIWVPVTTPTAEIFDSVRKAEVASFLRSVREDARIPVSDHMRRYLQLCLSGIKSQWHSKPTPYRQGDEKVVYLLAPLGDFFGKKEVPNQALDPTSLRDAGHL